MIPDGSMLATRLGTVVVMNEATPPVATAEPDVPAAMEATTEAVAGWETAAMIRGTAKVMVRLYPARREGSRYRCRAVTARRYPVAAR